MTKRKFYILLTFAFWAYLNFRTVRQNWLCLDFSWRSYLKLLRQTPYRRLGANAFYSCVVAKMWYEKIRFNFWITGKFAIYFTQWNFSLLLLHCESCKRFCLQDAVQIILDHIYLWFLNSFHVFIMQKFMVAFFSLWPNIHQIPTGAL